VLVQGNQWLCGGVPRAVLPLLGPLNGTFLAFPCFASPTLLPLAANESEATLSATPRCLPLFGRAWVSSSQRQRTGHVFSIPSARYHRSLILLIQSVDAQAIRAWTLKSASRA